VRIYTVGMDHTRRIGLRPRCIYMGVFSTTTQSAYNYNNTIFVFDFWHLHVRHQQYSLTSTGNSVNLKQQFSLLPFNRLQHQFETAVFTAFNRTSASIIQIPRTAALGLAPAVKRRHHPTPALPHRMTATTTNPVRAPALKVSHILYIII
jgi:hypothetical protein